MAREKDFFCEKEALYLLVFPDLVDKNIDILKQWNFYCKLLLSLVSTATICTISVEISNISIVTTTSISATTTFL